MNKLWTWFKSNAPWLLSGIGIVVGKWAYDKAGSISLTWLNILVVSVLFLTAYFFFSIFNALKNFLKQKNFQEWVKQKNIELFGLLVKRKSVYITTENKYECFELHQEYLNQVELIKTYICYSQGWLGQFSFIAGELHKDIKEGLREETVDKTKLEKSCKKLTTELGKFQKRIFNESCNSILKYFDKRSKTQPRICLKCVSRTEDNPEAQLVIAIFREEGNYEYESLYDVSENTGFDEVYKTGKYYICNDIPTALIKKKYRNPRVSEQKTKELYFDNFDENNPEKNETNWLQCWSMNKVGEDPKPSLPSKSSCYKSTLIIPLTLLNNDDLQQQFKNHFCIPDKFALDNHEDTGKAIYGFLCFDHQDVNYFNTDVDINMGYIFADILSIFLIHRLIYTEYSKTFSEAWNTICKKED